MKNLGLKRGTVKLTPYNLKWPALYEREKKIILKVVGDKIEGIEHHGSTAVPGISAKPIIDILLGISSLKKAEEFITPLAEIGYELRHDGTEKDRFFFSKGSGKKRTHHISVVEMNGPGWIRDLAFRNYLRRHKDAAKQYNDLKQLLAKKYPNNQEAYKAGKEAFIATVTKKR